MVFQSSRSGMQKIGGQKRWAKKERVAKEPNKVSKAFGGNTSDNVTIVFLFFNLLSQLRSNYARARLWKNGYKIFVLLDGDRASDGWFKRATSVERNTISDSLPGSFLGPVNPALHALLCIWLELYYNPHTFNYVCGTSEGTRLFEGYSQSLVRVNDYHDELEVYCLYRYGAPLTIRES